MRTDDPRRAIAKSRAMGMPDHMIVARLELQGWGADAIAAAMQDHTYLPEEDVVETLPPEVARFAVPESNKWLARAHVSAASAVVAVLAVAAIGVSSYSIYRPPVVYSISLPAAAGLATSSDITYGALPALSNPDYYNSVKTSLVEKNASFIVADLTAMRIRVYIDGEQKFEAPILAKGKPGSWWETPVGIYKIESKERDHFSSFGKVYQPWSLDFEGNFFIHGWPYYPDGKPVSTSYSGGCIRLSTEDAKSVYDLATISMPVIVTGTTTPSDSFEYQAQPSDISAAEYLVVDVKNGTILTRSQDQHPLPIASVTKLLTALVSIEYLNLDTKVTITQGMVIHTSKPRLEAGQHISVHDLLLILLTESSNQAAEALAGAVGRDRFIQLMNKKAQSIGLHNTSFADPSGISELNISTPEDLFLLLKYISENRRFIFDITNGTLKNDAYGSPAFANIQNFNFTPGVTNTFLGGKVGMTDEARETYAGMFVLPTSAGDRSIAVVVLGSDDEHADVRTLVQFVNKLYGNQVK